MIQEMRSRLNQAHSEDMELAALQTAFLYGMEPVVSYVSQSLGAARAAAMDREDFALVVHRVFKLSAARTRLVTKFDAVLTADEPWAAVEAGLQLMLHGQAPQPPTMSTPARPLQWRPSVAHTAPWWASRRYVSMGLCALAPAVLQIRRPLGVGRNRLQVAAALLCIVLVAIAYWCYGPWRRRRPVVPRL